MTYHRSSSMYYSRIQSQIVWCVACTLSIKDVNYIMLYISNIFWCFESDKYLLWICKKLGVLIQRQARNFSLKKRNYRILIERLWDKYFSDIYLLITEASANNFKSLKYYFFFIFYLFFNFYLKLIT